MICLDLPSLLKSKLSICLLSICVGVPAMAQTAPLAATPPMGWNSWNHFAEKVTDADVRVAADVMVSSGMRDAGYVYVNVDDTWEGQRDAQGRIHPNSRFPDMKALADYVHSKGLKFGIYSSPGPKTCAGFEGSYGHEEQDAQTYAEWGVDFLKYDLCGLRSVMRSQKPQPDWNKANAIMREAYLKMHEALVKTGRPIVYSICQYGSDSVWEWGAEVGGNLWRTTDDISDSFRSMALIGFSQAGLERYAGPGHWNDPDMLEIGNGHMTSDEYRTQMSLWAILAAPLLAGNDLSKMDDTTKSILMNREVIAVDQDRLGTQGSRLAPLQVWIKPLADGSKAVALFNFVTDDVPQPITLRFKDIGFSSSVHARDLWAHRDLGLLHDSYTVIPPKGGVVLLRVWQ
ncbi:glycoside hydrolase family 27 protein [Acidicapsa dinghuensis]|uniref:Alpha-galactosidase n=1 Tax=Acidicapsa dinghuensis TaxID=2218256 RepID=A0ABW1EIF1_9BACT|nr:glycoside hydrolase family 27 protein [Acidicapsa dinghuensis]